MTREPLDLAELDRALAGLERDLSGDGLRGLMVEAGRIVQSNWRDNVSAAGLVETGAYLESIDVAVIVDTPQRITVSVETFARDAHGFPYPAALEYGTDDVFPHPVGIRAFDESRRRVVKEVSDGIERKVRSRARKQ